MDKHGISKVPLTCEYTENVVKFIEVGERRNAPDFYS